MSNGLQALAESLAITGMESSRAVLVVLCTRKGGPVCERYLVLNDLKFLYFMF